MVVVKLYGGLGNQMFQYAAALRVARRYSTEVAYEGEYFSSPEKFGSHWSYQLNLLQTNITNWTPFFKTGFYFFYRIMRKLSQRGLYWNRFFYEKPFCYDHRISKVCENSFLDGYFQSEKYFKDIRSDILNHFKPRQPLSSINQAMVVRMADKTSIALHVRRGDYVSNPVANQVHGTCNLDYYQRAIEFFEKKFPDCVFYIFSDDLAWVKENLTLKSEVVYVDHNTGMNSYLDMVLMSHCQHNIIANSSFSWWGAWLNDNPSKIVIAPARWYSNPQNNITDIYPEEWLKF